MRDDHHDPPTPHIKASHVLRQKSFLSSFLEDPLFFFFLLRQHIPINVNKTILLWEIWPLPFLYTKNLKLYRAFKSFLLDT